MCNDTNSFDIAHDDFLRDTLQRNRSLFLKLDMFWSSNWLTGPTCLVLLLGSRNNFSKYLPLTKQCFFSFENDDVVAPSHYLPLFDFEYYCGFKLLEKHEHDFAVTRRDNFKEIESIHDSAW